jgi:hypothetical protein
MLARWWARSSLAHRELGAVRTLENGVKEFTSSITEVGRRPDLDWLPNYSALWLHV